MKRFECTWNVKWKWLIGSYRWVRWWHSHSVQWHSVLVHRRAGLVRRLESIHGCYQTGWIFETISRCEHSFNQFIDKTLRNRNKPIIEPTENHEFGRLATTMGQSIESFISWAKHNYCYATLTKEHFIFGFEKDNNKATKITWNSNKQSVVYVYFGATLSSFISKWIFEFEMTEFFEFVTENAMHLMRSKKILELNEFFNWNNLKNNCS